jgi:hypothetical protein
MKRKNNLRPNVSFHRRGGRSSPINRVRDADSRIFAVTKHFSRTKRDHEKAGRNIDDLRPGIVPAQRLQIV